MSTHGELSTLSDRGFVVVPKLLPDASIVTAREVLHGLVNSVGGPSSGDLDCDVLALAADNRSAIGVVYDAFRDTETYRNLVSHPALVDWMKATLQTDTLHSPFVHTAFRLDLFQETWHAFNWHQDFPYNALSADSLTAWIPLSAVGPWNGSVDVVPGSHDRLYPVNVTHKRDADGSKRSALEAFIVPRFGNEFEAQAQKITMAAGDVLIFHNRLVHRSGILPGPAVRYSIQVRFGRLFAPEVVERRYAHRSREGFHTFKSLYPELVEMEES